MQLRIQSDIVRDNGRAIHVLLQPMQSEQELFDSQNTLRQVELILMMMAQTLAHFPSPIQTQLPEIEWSGWQALYLTLLRDQQPRREQIWYAVRSLVPHTLMLLEQLRRRHPEWFEFGY